MQLLVAPADGRLRAGWRLLIQLAAMSGVVVVLTVPLIVLHLAGAAYWLALLANQVAIFVAIMVTVPLARRLLDKRSVSSLGLAWPFALTDLAAGVVIAGVMMNAIFVLEQALGWATIESVAWQTASRAEILLQLLLWFFIFAIVGWQEEFLARGYWLQTVAEGTNPVVGAGVSSALFALLHMTNPNASAAALAGLFAAGVFMAAGYWLTRQLWLPIGLHIGWNFFEGNVFGFPVSGLDTFRLVQLQVSGPELWTGGAFGPEAGLILYPALLLGFGLMLGYARILRGTTRAPT